MVANSTLKLLRDSVMKATVQQAGQAVGFGNGELAALLYNLDTIFQVLSPVPWSMVYALGVGRGQPGLFYAVIALLTGVKLWLLRLLPAEAAKAGKPPEPEPLPAELEPVPEEPEPEPEPEQATR